MAPADPPRRVSVFREIGLDDEDHATPRAALSTVLRPQRPQLRVRFRSSNSIINPTGEATLDESDEWEDIDDSEDDDLDDLSDEDQDTIRVQPRASLPYRLTLLALFVAIALPIVQSAPYFSNAKDALFNPWKGVNQGTEVQKRADSPTDVCKRWSQQSALVNGTLYMFGGRASNDSQQTSGTWNNNFVSLDLTKTWQISDPALTGQAQPSGPPPVANGFLWNSHDSLYLYGGEFSDNPTTSPVPFSMWEYDISGGNWVEHESPKTSSGKNAEPEGQAVQRAAEGAGAGVAALGRGWYFGGHLDFLTTYEWSNQIARVYIKSLIEFTLPGFSNSGVDSLSNGQKSGNDGSWRNVTSGGVQDTNGFPERADGLLVYVPGFGAEGVLLGLAGGTNSTFTQMNVIDVYDIADSTWYKQSTTGTTPKGRVNPCAVVAAAPDGSSYNMYMYGGQNLQPYQEQIQYDDMWILSIPSFTWIEVKTDSQVPPGRSGHSCNIWDGQMVMVGGYVGQDISCDSPGIYVFNLTSLTWNNQFSALTGAENIQNQNAADFNPFSQQSNQLTHKSNNGAGGLEGSYGYSVPQPVYSAIGGNSLGGATITKPVATPTGGPLATGGPITYTVTGPDGQVITSVSDPNNTSNRGGSGTNVGAIVAGVVAGVFAILAGYFAFCAWIYRKQLQLYKNHAAAAAARNTGEKDAFLAPGSGTAAAGGGAALGIAASKSSSERAHSNSYHSRTGSAGNGAASDPRTPVGGPANGNTAYGGRASMDSTDDLMAGQEPSFWGVKGVLLNPRRSLRVINRD